MGLATCDESAYWVLYGTSECHLCDQAGALLEQLALARPVTWQFCDIITLPPEAYTRLETRIPVLQALTPLGTQELCWPFGLMDLRQFFDHA